MGQSDFTQPVVGGVGPASSHAASFDVEAAGLFDNVGATGSITATWTTATRGTFMRVADFDFSVKPPSGKRIYWSGGVMDVDEAMILSDTPSTCSLVLRADGHLQLESIEGNAQEATP